MRSRQIVTPLLQAQPYDPATMMSCIRCQETRDDGYIRVNLGLCEVCARELQVIIHANRRSNEGPRVATLELPGTYR